MFPKRLVSLPSSLIISSIRKISHVLQVLDYFTKYYGNTIPLMPDLLHQYQHNPKGFLGAVQCYPWNDEDNLVLLGDAAHAIIPFFGQGCNAAFETVEKLCGYMDKAARVKVKDCQTFKECTPISNCNVALQKYSPVMANAFNTLSKVHKPNADAICTMAVENYFEMMAKTGDNHFLQQKQLENKLANAFPDVFLSRYAMVTHTLIPYYACMAIGAAQQRILDALLPPPTANTKTASLAAATQDVALDLPLATKLVQQHLQPVLAKFHIETHDLRDVTRELVLGVGAAAAAQSDAAAKNKAGQKSEEVKSNVGVPSAKL